MHPLERFLCFALLRSTKLLTSHFITTGKVFEQESSFGTSSEVLLSLRAACCPDYSAEEGVVNLMSSPVHAVTLPPVARAKAMIPDAAGEFSPGNKMITPFSKIFTL